MKQILSLLLLILLTFTCKSQYKVDERAMSIAVSVDFSNGSSGSAFVLADSPYLFLVTARHVIYQIDPNGNPTNALIGDTTYLTIYSTNLSSPHKTAVNLKDAISNNLIGSDATHDIAIIPIAKLNGNKINYFSYVYNDPNESKAVTPVFRAEMINFNMVDYGADVYILGYPKSLRLFLNQLEIEKPLLMRGIVAGKNTIRNTIIINSQVHHGDSGGPVFVSSDGQFKVAGITTELIPFASDIWQNGKPLKDIGVMNNSNFSVVQPSDNILQLIDKIKPILPK